MTTRTVVDWFASVGVTVINRSLGSRYDGPGDGRGGIDGVAAYAISRGHRVDQLGRQRRLQPLLPACGSLVG